MTIKNSIGIGKDRFTINIPKFHFGVLAENNVTRLKPVKIGPITDANLGFTDCDIKRINWKVKLNSGRSVIAFHAPPGFDCWAEHGMDEVQTNRFVNGVVKKHPYKIPLVLTSHIHGYEKIIKDNTTYVLSGGGGAPQNNIPSCVEKVFNFKEQNGKWGPYETFIVQ